MSTAEYSVAGAMRSRTVHGPGVDDPLAWYSGAVMDSTTLRFLHADRQGSIALLGDAAGNAVRIFAYDEYGTPMASGAAGGLLPDNGARHLYTGQAWMPGMGMYYYKARMYSPTLGRFMQTDPIGYEDQMNLYAYVGGDPMNRSDPTGMKLAVFGGCPTGSGCTMIRVGSGSDVKIYVPTGISSISPEGEIIIDHWITIVIPTVNLDMFRFSLPQNKQCSGPPAAPGTGSTQAELAARARINAAEASKHYFQFVSNMTWFKSMVQNKGPWDYKQNGRGYEDFGNYNYGYTGVAAGISPNLLRQRAGMAQISAGTSQPGWGEPGPMGLFGGTAPYGDDPHDQEMINRGIADRRNGC